MAKLLSVKNLPTELKYEPSFELKFGIADEVTDIETATLANTHFPLGSKSKRHYHTEGNPIWYCMSGKGVWCIGEEQEEFVTEAGDLCASIGTRYTAPQFLAKLSLSKGSVATEGARIRIRVRKHLWNEFGIFLFF